MGKSHLLKIVVISAGELFGCTYVILLERGVEIVEIEINHDHFIIIKLVKFLASECSVKIRHDCRIIAPQGLIPEKGASRGCRGHQTLGKGRVVVDVGGCAVGLLGDRRTTASTPVARSTGCSALDQF